MAPKKQTKTETKAEKPDPKFVFGTPDWFEEREAELDDAMRGRDVTQDTVLKMSWNGWYKVRAVPVVDKRDYLRPKGEHWNVFPTGDPKRPASQHGCPAVNFQDEEGQIADCPICNGVTWALANRKATFDDFSGKGGIALQKKYLLRVELVAVKLLPGAAGTDAPPVFKDLPQLKILEVPKTVAKWIREQVADEDIGWNTIFHPYLGRAIKITRDDTQAGKDMYKCQLMLEPSEVSAEFLDVEEVKDEDGDVIEYKFHQPENYPVLKDFLPKTTQAELMALIEKHQNDINPLIANHALSIEGEVVSQRALPPGESDEGKPTSQQKLEEIRAKMKRR